LAVLLNLLVFENDLLVLFTLSSYLELNNDWLIGESNLLVGDFDIILALLKASLYCRTFPLCLGEPLCEAFLLSSSIICQLPVCKSNK